MQIPHSIDTLLLHPTQAITRTYYGPVDGALELGAGATDASISKLTKLAKNTPVSLLIEKQNRLIFPPNEIVTHLRDDVFATGSNIAQGIYNPVSIPEIQCKHARAALPDGNQELDEILEYMETASRSAFRAYLFGITGHLIETTLSPSLGYGFDILDVRLNPLTNEQVKPAGTNFWTKIFGQF